MRLLFSRHTRGALLPIAGLALLLAASPAARALEIALDAKADASRQPLVHGTTNLPDGAVLSVTVAQEAGGFSATLDSVVQGGRFSAGPFTRDGHDLDPGEYKIEVVLEMSAQPAAVRHIIGSHGMKMEGDLTRQSSTGQYIDYTTGFTAPAAAGAAAGPGAAAPPSDAWLTASCTDRVDFLNRTIRSKAVGGHELAGAERDRWIDDCVRQTRLLPHNEVMQPLQ